MMTHNEIVVMHRKYATKDVLWIQMRNNDVISVSPIKAAGHTFFSFRGVLCSSDRCCGVTVICWAWARCWQQRNIGWRSVHRDVRKLSEWTPSNCGYEDCSIDDIPWEIHKIDNPIARRRAKLEYLAASQS